MTLYELLSVIGTVVSIIPEARRAKEKYDASKGIITLPDCSLVPPDLEQYQTAVDAYLSDKMNTPMPIISPQERGEVYREFYKRYPELYSTHDYSDRLIDKAINELEAYLKKRMSVGEQVIKGQLNSMGEQLTGLSDKLDTLEALLQRKPKNTSLKSYYERKRKEFESPQQDSVVGDTPLKDSYIEIEVNRRKTEGNTATDYIVTWCKNYPYGAHVIYGEPGHGKTTFGLKLVYDYIIGKIDFKVFSFPLVSPYSHIIEGNDIHIYDALLLDRFKAESKLDDELIENSLIILDGYDELQATLPEDHPFANFTEFFCRVEEFAVDKKAHILITTRSMTIKELSREDLILLRDQKKSLVKMELMTKMFQEEWVKEHKPDYLSKFLHFREKYYTAKKPTEEDAEDDILGIPFIFLMLVEAEFDDDADNLVGLYDKLFDATFKRRFPNMSSDQIEFERKKYENLAYLMYLDRGKYAELSDNNRFGDLSLYTYSYYMKVFLSRNDQSACKENGDDQKDSVTGLYEEVEEDEDIEKKDPVALLQEEDNNIEIAEYKRFIEFYHKTFYEYFLAYHLYDSFQSVDEESVDDFLYSLGGRRIEFYVLKYLKQIVENRQGESQTYNDTVQRRIEQTNALIIRDEKDPMQWSNNIFANAMMLMNVFAGGLVIHKNLTNTFSNYVDNPLCAMLRNFKCQRIDLSGCKMVGAHIDRADFRKSDFIGADMSGKADLSMSFFNTCNFKDANMEDIQMYRTIFDGSFFISTNMKHGRYEEASFMKTKFEKADLSGANLIRSNFSSAKLTDVIVDEKTDFTGAILDKMKTNVDLSICIPNFAELVEQGKIVYVQ